MLAINGYIDMGRLAPNAMVSLRTDPHFCGVSVAGGMTTEEVV